jgi:hypothetical protein
MSWPNIIDVALTLPENNQINNHVPKLNVLALASERGFFPGPDNLSGIEGSGLLTGSSGRWFVVSAEC